MYVTKTTSYETKRNNANNDNISTDDNDDVYLNALNNRQSDTLT